ncbi:MAG: nucleotidyltransferase family protein [Chthoniobacterales bacterium]
MIAAILLAAGGSSRFGRPKQLVRIGGESLVSRAARVALESGCQPVVVVVGRDREKIATELQDLPVTLVPNETWIDGMGGSIRAGLQALPDCPAVVILVCDQPHVDAELIRCMIRTQEQTQQPIVACAYAGTLGVPVLFARDFFPELLSLSEQGGARSVLDAHPSAVAQINFPEGEVDIDTPADYERLPED